MTRTARTGRQPHWARLALLCAALLSRDVRAVPPRCPAIAGGDATLAALDVEARLDFIRARLRHDAFRARQWGMGFGTSYAIITAGGGTLAAASKERGKKADAYAGAAGSVIGLGLLLAAPLSVVEDHERLEAEVRAYGVREDPCRLLARAESMLIRDAKNEAFNRGWFTHTGNALIGVASLLVLGLGYRHWASGTVNGVSSIAVGELMIALQPAGLIRDLAAYRRGDLSSSARRRRRFRR